MVSFFERSGCITRNGVLRVYGLCLIVIVMKLLIGWNDFVN